MNFSGLKVKFVKNHINLDSSRPLFQFLGTFIEIFNLSMGAALYKNGHMSCDSLMTGFGHFRSKKNVLNAETYSKNKRKA